MGCQCANIVDNGPGGFCHEVISSTWLWFVSVSSPLSDSFSLIPFDAVDMHTSFSFIVPQVVARL